MMHRQIFLASHQNKRTAATVAGLAFFVLATASDALPLPKTTGMIEYTTPGTFTFIVPEGVTSLFLTGGAGGDGGAPGAPTCGSGCPGSGGHGGLGKLIYSLPPKNSSGDEVPISVNYGDTISITVGKGGSSGQAGTSSIVILQYGLKSRAQFRSNGNTYCFGCDYHYLVQGGSGANHGNEFSEGGHGSAGVAGGAGGQSSSGNENQNWGGMGGGGGAGSAPGGNGGRGGFDGGSQINYSHNGGSGNPDFKRLHNGQPGQDGKGRGAGGGGGGGGGDDFNSVGGAGGNGGPGYVKIEY